MKKMMKLVSIMVALSALVLTGCEVDPEPEDGTITVNLTNGPAMAMVSVGVYPNGTTLAQAGTGEVEVDNTALFASETYGGLIGNIQTGTIAEDGTSSSVVMEMSDAGVSTGDEYVFSAGDYVVIAIQPTLDATYQVIGYTGVAVNVTVDGDAAVTISAADFE